MSNYTIGIDYGTLSGRAVLVDVSSGEELAAGVFAYPHGVMDTAMPGGAALGRDWALQHPQDYLDVLTHTVPDVLARSGVNPADVVGIGTDFTACTVLPAKADGTPLCFLPEYRDNPHAWVKLWKHHAAQGYADRLNEIAAARGEVWLADYGGKISSEWSIPKLWQVLDEAPEVYAAADRWIEAADWIVWQLCGTETRNSCAAGYKAMYHKTRGYPSRDFFRALDPRLGDVTDGKLGPPVIALGRRAGGLTAAMAQRLRLRAGTAVSVGNVDAHVCVPAVGIDRPGRMLAIMGTSTCHMMVGERDVQVPGICGVVADGILPGFYGYEAGQSCVGDHFGWFLDNCLPEAYGAEARRQGVGLHKYLREKAKARGPGASGLLALDWWNGNRSVLADADLSGVLLGATLATRPEDIYRALIEATAYGTRVIVDNYRAHGVPVEAFYASGGISQKDELAMQIYADVLNMPIHIAGTGQGPALGSAIFAAMAAGAASGGYDDLGAASRAMAKVKNERYVPVAAHAAVYDRLYAEYATLHDYFGRGGNDVMKRLKGLAESVG
ncbi:MAG: ribulokinase [Oscillospiraceae bacterium]|jgi:L-ribulokinase|nr:ribulokinase [Oscillospiraceae bacterium]